MNKTRDARQDRENRISLNVLVEFEPNHKLPLFAQSAWRQSPQIRLTY